MGSWIISAAVEVIITFLHLFAAIGSRLTQDFFISPQITATASSGFYDGRLNTTGNSVRSEKRSPPALEQYNMHVRQLGLTLIEDEETGKIIHCVSFVVD